MKGQRKSVRPHHRRQLPAKYPVGLGRDDSHFVAVAHIRVG